MLKFEIKKLIKSNIFIITIIFSFVMALYTNYISNNSTPIDLNYPSYEEGGPTLIFFRIIDNQVYSFDNREEFFEEYNQAFLKYARESHSKLKHFLVNYRKYSFKEMYEQGKFIQKLDYDFFQNLKKYMDKYPFVIKDEATKKTFDYGIFESEYYHDNDILFTKSSEEILSTNYARRIVYNSKIIFGIPYLAFMILCFYGILSKEQEKGTITLLRTQPKSIRRLIYSKIIPIVLNSIIYVFSFFIFFYIICAVQGIRLWEFRDIFRIYNIGDEIKYIKASHLIPLILLSFIILNILFASIILFVNVITRSDSKSISILIVFSGLMYTLTENISVLQNRYNPIFAMDHVRSLIGTTKEIVKVDGTSLYEYIYQSSSIYLLGFLIVSFVIVEVSIRIFNHDLRTSLESKKEQRYSNNILRFEINKLIKNKGFVIYLLGAMVIIFSIYSFNIKEVNDKLKFEVGDNGAIKYFRDRIKQLEEDIEYLGEENAELLIMDLEDKKQKYDLMYNINKYYKANDSRKFYEYLNDRDDTYFNYNATSYYAYKSGQAYIISKFETNMLNSKAIEENIKPIYRKTFLNSEYDEFTTRPLEHYFRKENTYLTNSSIYSNFKMLKYQDLDIIFMVLVLFMVISGYVSEKDYGKNLDLIYTQPIDKRKYHITKIISQAIVIVGVYIFLSLFIFLIGIVVEGIGEYRQPIIEYLKLTSKPNSITSDEAIDLIRTIPIYIYLLRVLLVIGVQALLLSSIATLISIFIKDRILLTILVGIIYVIGFLSNSVININAFKLFNPFTYTFASQITDNTVMVKYKILNASFINSIFIILAWSIVITFVGAIIARNKYQKY